MGFFIKPVSHTQKKAPKPPSPLKCKLKKKKGETWWKIFQAQELKVFPQTQSHPLLREQEKKAGDKA